jgi:hypothetical protein
MRSSSSVLIAIVFAATTDGPLFSQLPAIKGPGCTTATMIDWDCDGYGPGSPFGPDADDNDPTVNTPATALAKYGSTAAIVTHLGYNPVRRLFISTAGNNSAGQPNNENLPYATWAFVSKIVKPGDAVIWRAGTYPMSAPLNITGGTSTAPVVYMAYPGEKVVLDWSAVASDGVRADGLSYWTVDGLVIKGGTNGYGIAEQQYNDVTNMTLRNVETSGWYNGVFFMDHMSNILIERSVFHDLNINGEHNLYIGNSTGPSPNLTFRNNIVYKAGQGGGHNLHLNGRFPNAYVGGNIFYADLNQCIGMQMGINHSMFENNICFTSANPPVFIYDYYQNTNSNIQAYDQNYNTFRNNTFYYDGTNYYSGVTTCGQFPFWVRDDSAGGGSLSNPTNASHDLGHNTYDNNIFYTGCTGSAAALRYDSDYNGHGGTEWLATDTWRNNVIYSVGGGYGGGFLLIGNYRNTGLKPMTFAQFQSANLGGSTNLQSNPVLAAVNPAWYNAAANFDLRFQTGSPASGAGLASDAPATDIAGIPRGGAPSIGAYQLSASATTAPPLTIVSASLPAGAVGTAYLQALIATGGTAPYTWSIVSGSLPPGLALSSGTIGGTPAAAGSFNFTAKASDSASRTATVSLSISIAAPSVAAALSSLSCAADSLSSNASTTCTVTLATAAGPGGASVALSANSPLVTLPSSVAVPSGGISASFAATAGALSSNVTAVITASLGTGSLAAGILLQASAGPVAFPAPAALTALACTGGALSSSQSTTCTVGLTGAAPSGGAAVMLFVNTGLLAMPETVVVPADSSTATFTVTARTVSAAGAAAITAFYAGASVTAGLGLR